MEAGATKAQSRIAVVIRFRSVASHIGDEAMRYYLAPHCVLKRLEAPCLYDIRQDELYELDEQAFAYLIHAAEPSGAGSPEDRAFLESCLEEGLLITSPLASVRPAPRESPVPSLRYLELQITNRCNLHCRHCYVGTPAAAELSIEELKTILDEFQDMQGLRLLITGGEPILHRQFGAFNELLPDYAFRKVLFTNGQALDGDLLRRLRVDEIQVSIDGMQRGHDLIRGPGTFRKALDAAERIHRAGIPLSVATMVHSGNLDEFDEMKALFAGMGVRDWTVDIPSPAGGLLEHPELMVPPEVAGRYLAFGFGGGLHGGGEGYACGLHLASILANGDICKCAFYADAPVGTIREGLASAWAKIRPVPLSGLDCSAAGCPVLHECRGGCRYRAEHGSGLSVKQESAPDLYKCFAYGIIESASGHEDRD